MKHQISHPAASGAATLHREPHGAKKGSAYRSFFLRGAGSRGCCATTAAGLALLKE
jgi:hypothetical protein